MIKTKVQILKELQTIPGVGKSISQDLWDLGIRSIDDLKNKKPQKLYDEMCSLTNTRQDPCLLYVFRCAVYFASNKIHDPELLKWWKWKDKEC
ncbi:MAG: helix-hairpin-helix domain-containing protein [FCB group bacterium]|jgi:hypothetical protein